MRRRISYKQGYSRLKTRYDITKVDRWAHSLIKFRWGSVGQAGAIIDEYFEKPEFEYEEDGKKAKAHRASFARWCCCHKEIRNGEDLSVEDETVSWEEENLPALERYHLSKRANRRVWKSNKGRTISKAQPSR